MENGARRVWVYRAVGVTWQIMIASGPPKRQRFSDSFSLLARLPSSRTIIRRSARLYVLPRITPKKGNLSSRFALAC